MELLSKKDAIAQSSFLQKVYNFFNFESERKFLIFSGGFIIVTLTISNLFAIVTTYAQLKFSWGIAHKKGLQLLCTYVDKPYSYFLNANTSDLRAYLINEVSVLTSGILLPLIEFFSRVIICLTIFSLLLVVSPLVTVTVLVALGGSYILIYASRQRFLKKLGSERIEANVDRYRYLEEMLTGIKTVKIYGVQEFFYRRFERASERFTDIHPKVRLVYLAPKYILELIAFGGILLITMYFFISTGDFGKTLPRLSFYALAGYRLLPSLQHAFSSMAKFRHNLPSLHKLYDDMIKSVDQEEGIFKQEVHLNYKDRIKIEKLVFRYDDTDRNVVDGLDIQIAKGNTIAFVGSTGSGKTTLVDLITGLLQPTSGEIIVDNQLVAGSNIEKWQRNIAYVPQEVFLYDDTIKANITLGIDESKIDQDKLQSVLKMADIFDFIMDLPMQIDTEIGERGVRLSGGQRQRLGLARALYTLPSLLILDEATSALDNITENGIMESIGNLPKEMTVIIIAHRMSTVKNADIIYLLEKGKVNSYGTYNGLMKNNEAFRSMVELS